MKKDILFLLLGIILLSCGSKKKEKVDLLILGPTIYTMEEDSTTFSAMAVKGDTIYDLGTQKDFKEKYESSNTINMEGKFMYPGLIDAHSHFYGLGKSLFITDLRGAESEDDMLKRLGEFYKNQQPSVIRGRGWDQNLWDSKKFPTKDKLDSLYPDVPVILNRVDGHAALVNQVALDLANVNEATKISGGELIIENGKLTGVLIDNAIGLVSNELPDFSKEEAKKILLMAEEHCLQYGLTTVCDAGINKKLIDIYTEMFEAGELSIRVYAMADPDPTTFGWLLENGELKTSQFHIRAIKFYMDGAMGSRGACLIQPYSDQPDHYGHLLNSQDTLREVAIKLNEKGLQLNVHCIGDSANRVTLSTMAEVLGGPNELRWRIEHVQLIHEQDWHFFADYNIIPSMQPTHATSDGSWVGDRIGEERLRYAYALSTALSNNGVIALGTDFPVEKVNPFFTFYAAITRKNPETGWTADWMNLEKLTRTQALKGMTYWAAYSQFEEDEKGSLAVGKLADFIIMDEDLFSIDESKIPGIKPLQVYIGGKLVAGKNE